MTRRLPNEAGDPLNIVFTLLKKVIIPPQTKPAVGDALI